jgi:hemoglobin/transferrin/lactoferrin receptor protein
MKDYWFKIWQISVSAILFSVCFSISHSQTITFSGQVIDAVSKLPISKAIVEVLEIGQRKSTDDFGYFRYNQIRVGRYTLSVHHIAYAYTEQYVVLTLNQNDTIVINMHPVILKSGEVIIRSTRTSSVISNTPYPMDVAMSEELIRLPNVTISDALNKLSGIALVRDGTWETDISIRGMGRSNIVTMIDNTRIETAQDIAGALSLINVNDLERIETLKSSGSVLYGTGALGGVLHLATKRPSFSDQLQLNGELVNSATSVDDGLSHYAAIEASNNRYAVRMSSGYRRAGNTMTPDGVLLNSQYHDFSLNGSLGIRTFDNQSLFISYQRLQAEDTGIPGGSAFGLTSAVRYTLARRELIGLEYNIPNISQAIALLTVRLSHQEIDRNVEIIQSPLVTVTPHAVHNMSSIQVESKLCPLPNHLLVLGTEAWERELDSRRERLLKNKNQTIGERPIPASKYFSGGVYLQDEWTIVQNKLTSLFGVRCDWIRVRNDKTFNPEYIITSGILRTNSVDSTILWNGRSAHDRSWSANAGLQCSLSPYLDISFLAATAFRSPSLEERYQYLDLGNIVHVGDPNLQPERSLSLNIGTRAHTDGLNIQTDIFLNQLTNLITEVPGVFENRTALIKKNIGKARLYGFEISGEKSLTTRTILKTSIAYVRGEDTYSHTNLPQIAPFSGQMELNNHFHSVGTLDISCYYSSTQNNLAPGEIHTPGYMVFDLSWVSVPWNIGGLSLTVRSGIKNLFDRGYQSHLSTLRGVVKSEPRRNFFVSATLAL